MTEIIAIFLGACLVNNLILDGMLGVTPAMAVSKKINTAIGMGHTMVFVLTIAALVTYPLKFYVLVPLHMEHFELISFIIVISISVLLVLKGLKKFKPVFCDGIDLFLPLAMMNTAVLGSALLNVQGNHGVIASLFFGLGSGLGFSLVLVLMTTISERLTAANVPRSFKGAAISLITLGIISMAFSGFIGFGYN